ncbi:MAG: Ku protein [Polyangiaceae bacterium]|jgi:DNA end-binding protein Ku
MRAIWTGEIAFGLVTIPAKLYTATRDLTPQFNMLHKECGTKIQMVRRCPKCQRDVEWGELGKGYEVEKGVYALFSKEELAKLEGDETAGAIEIVEFVDPVSIDLAYIDKSYWVGPGGKSSRGFTLLREALEKSKRVALAKTKLRTRTRLAILRPRGKIFALEMMRYADEIVSDGEIDVPESPKVATEKEMGLALDLVKTLSGPFDPAKHPDEYRAAVEAAVEEKVASDDLARQETTGEAAPEAPAAAGGKVIDLAELLSRSLKKVEPKGGVKKAAANDEGAADEKKQPGTSGTKKSGAKDGKKRAAG